MIRRAFLRFLPAAAVAAPAAAKMAAGNALHGGPLTGGMLPGAPPVGIGSPGMDFESSPQFAPLKLLQQDSDRRMERMSRTALNGYPLEVAVIASYSPSYRAIKAAEVVQRQLDEHRTIYQRIEDFRRSFRMNKSVFGESNGRART